MVLTYEYLLSQVWGLEGDGLHPHTYGLNLHPGGRR